MTTSTLTESLSKDAHQVVRVGAYPHRVAETTAWERSEFARYGVGYEFFSSLGAATHASLSEADAIISGGVVWNADSIALLHRCRILLSCSVGLDGIDLDGATQQGVQVVNMPDLCVDEVADHTFALILACVRKIVILATETRGGSWTRESLEPMPRLRGLTLGVVGFGRTARAVAERAHGFGMQVLACDPYDPPTMAGVVATDLPTLFSTSDIVSCHVPLLPTTRHLVGRGEFALMKDSAFFVNTSRGAVVDEVALVDVLRQGRIAGAGLDVLEQEPPAPSHPLLDLPNVVVTPHAAGYSDTVVQDIPRRAVEFVVSSLHAAPTLGTPTRGFLDL